jgi:hypothetical protein
MENLKIPTFAICPVTDLQNNPRISEYCAILGYAASSGNFLPKK